MTHSKDEFFRTVLPESGIVVVARLAPAKGSVPVHDKYANIDAMLEGLADARYDKENYYFAVSTYDQWDGILERGKMRFRTQSNAKLTRCIILDVDIKNQEGYYLTKDEAWEGIHKLSYQLNMPNAIIVDSGFGYHVYWPMLAGIPSREWQAVAKLFYQACAIVEPKAVADASRVSDSASILRIPDSLNLKFGQQAPVGIVQWYDRHLDLGEFRGTLQRVTGNKTANGAAGKPLVSLEVQSEFDKAQLLPTLKNCNWAGTYMKNQATAQEPAWYAMLGMAPFIEHTTSAGTTVNGIEIAKLFSKGHPDYSEDATIAKYHQAKAAQTGPTTCAKFQQIDSKPCETCPFRGAVKAPVSASRLARPATGETVVTTTVVTDEGDRQQEDVVVPIPPKPYFRGESGGVYARVKVKVEDGFEEEIVKVYDYDIYPVKRFRSELMEEEHIELHLWLPKDGMRRFKMPTETLVDHKRLGSFLASRGAIGEQGSSLRMSKYMIDYVRHMQTEAIAEVEYSRFGWRDINSSTPKFVVGNGFVDSAGVVHPAAFPAHLRSAATAVAQHGDMGLWREGFDVYNKIPNSEGYIFTACMGFAAPLMALTQYAGVLANMVGHSGAGKSAALDMMTSVWGQPKAARVNVKDTQIAMYNTIGYLNSVPVAFDEITTMESAFASDFALNFTGGRGKERAGRDGQNKENHITWDTIVVCSSNTSMYSKFTAARKGYNAEAMRLFEFNVPMSQEQYKPIMDKAQSLIRGNYGHAGREFIGIVMRNRPAIMKAIEEKANSILKKTGGSNAERFWATLHACWYVGNTIAYKKNIHGYDVDKIMVWATEQTHVAREATGKAAADPRAMIGEFINASLDSMIRVRDNKVDLTVNVNQPRSIKGRLEYTGDTLVHALVSAKALTDYCNYSHIDSSWLIEELKRAGVTDGISRPARLASGTNFPNPTVRSFTIDFAKQTEGVSDGTLVPKPPTGA